MVLLMAARRVPLLFLLGLFALAGCRDALVDEQFQPENPPSVDAPVENSIYVKGPSSLGIGATGNYRAQAVQGVVRYEWSQDSIAPRPGERRAHRSATAPLRAYGHPFGNGPYYCPSARC